MEILNRYCAYFFYELEATALFIGCGCGLNEGSED